MKRKNTYLNQRCDRCGSKRRIERTWKEKIPTLTGTTNVEYSQIICINQTCQAAFEKVLLTETKKREVARAEKEANIAVRKASSLLQAKKARANKSRI